MGAIIGASLAGVKSLTATSGPGFSLKMENLGFACIAEVPCVIVNVMRGGPSTGLPTHPAQADFQQARWGTHGDHPVIVLAPSYLIEIYNETIRAFNLSEKYRVPVIILIDEILGHMSEGVVLPHITVKDIFNRMKPNVPPEKYNPFDTSYGDVPPMANYFEGYRFHITGLNHDKTGFPTTNPEICNSEEKRLMRKVEANIKDIEKYQEIEMEDAEIGLFSFGSSVRASRVAMKMAREQGVKVGLFRPVTVWPFPYEAILKYRTQLKGAIVPEMNLGQMRVEVERVFGPDMPVYGVNRVGGVPIEPEEIYQKIMEIK
jgi:2-oxoglutarate ferredoxin oxidoreductase subunit alpha